MAMIEFSIWRKKNVMLIRLTFHLVGCIQITASQNDASTTFGNVFGGFTANATICTGNQHRFTVHRCARFTLAERQIAIEPKSTENGHQEYNNQRDKYLQ